MNLNIFLSLSLICSCFAGGLVELDSLTFDKILNKFRTVIVKFDQQFPYGDTHEAYSAFASQINNKTLTDTDQNEILTAAVGIKDYGEYDNKDLGERFGVKSGDPNTIPAIKLFIDNNLENPINFNFGSEKLTVGRLFKFVKERSRTYIHIPGCVKELDELTIKFMSDEKSRQEVLKVAEEFIGKIECEKRKSLAKIYIVVMKGILDKGEDFIAQQNERINKLLNDKLSEKKIEELNQRLNILSSFKVLTNSISKDEL